MLEMYPLRDASWKGGELCAREEHRLEETETELPGREESALRMTTFVNCIAQARSHTFIQYFLLKQGKLAMRGCMGVDVFFCRRQSDCYRE